MTWGHNDKRLFVATGCIVHMAWVSMRIASLQLMASLQVKFSRENISFILSVVWKTNERFKIGVVAQFHLIVSDIKSKNLII